MTTIKVLDKDIAEGTGGCGLSCAIALAVRREFKTNDVYVNVDYEDDDDERHVVILVKNKKFKVGDPDVEYFISDFDMGYEVHPIEFTMEEV